MKKERYIYERKTKKGSPYFQIQISFKDEFNKTKTFYQNVQIDDFPSRSVALKYAKSIRDKALIDINANRIAINTPTIETLIKSQSVLIPCSIRTQEKYNSLYKNIPQSLLTKPINRISLAMLQNEINTFSLSHTEDRTKRYLVAWRRLYTTANMLGHDISDKTRLVIIPKNKIPHTPKSVVISFEDFQTILDGLHNYQTSNKRVKHRYRMIWYLLQIMFYTGMRPAEVIALNSDDIGETISVNKAVGSSNTQALAVITPKTRSSIRDIPISEELRPILNNLLLEQSTSPLLTELDGSLLSINKISNEIQNIAKKNDIRFNAYMLRHLVATNLVSANTSPRAIQDILGHTSFSMSLDYARSTEEERKSALQKIEKMS